MDRVRKVIHARTADIFPYTGAGVTAAILDTGERVIILSS